MNLKKDSIINILWVFIPLLILFIFFIPKYLKKGEEVKQKSADLKYKINPQSIIHQINIKGAKAVVRELNEIDYGTPWGTITSKIETGKPEWIEVAKKLRLGTDAGYTNDLDFSLSMALANSPQSVLKASNIDDCSKPEEFCIDRICANLFPEEGTPKEGYLDDKSIIKILQEKKRSVEKISNVELMKKRDQCLSSLEKAILDMRNLQKEE
jgi:hypothetical protein